MGTEPENSAGENGRPTRRDLFRGAGAALALSSLISGCEKRTRDGVAYTDEVPGTDPSLVRYAQQAALKPGVPSPRAVAVASDGALWVAGNGVAHRLAVDEAGKVTASLSFPGQAEALALRDDALLVGVGDRVIAVTLAGREPRVWAEPGPGTVVTCIATGADVVLVADAGHRRILRYDGTGTLRDTLCEKKEGYGGLIVPSPHLDLAVGADGTIYVVNPGRHWVEVRDPSGALQWTWGETSQEMPGFSGCCNPTDMALLPDGRYVTAEKGIPRVKVYDRQGHFECVVAGPEHLSPGVVGLDVAALPDGRIAVLDPALGAVRVFQRKEGA